MAAIVGAFFANQTTVPEKEQIRVRIKKLAASVAPETIQVPSVSN